MPTSVWDAVSGVHRPKPLLPLVGSSGYISSFVICASVLPSFRVRLPSCRQLCPLTPDEIIHEGYVEEGVRH